MKQNVIGLLAHVDAGKTTLAEALLFHSGVIRSQGRVDSGNTILDNHSLEKERGITIFAGQAHLTVKNTNITLLDTPGHIDFSTETERILKVLDYAVLVISGLDCVQAHTKTLWKLCEYYQIPVFIFVTKMDFSRLEKSQILSDLTKQLDENCIDFSEVNDDYYEKIASCSEDTLERYIETQTVSDEDIKILIRSRKLFPCYFGSGLKGDGITEFLTAIDRFTLSPKYPDVFGARVFKITHDNSGNRLTHIKITGGSLKVKDTLKTSNVPEKINQIRKYSGNKFITCDEAFAGEICTITGLNNSYISQGLGFESESNETYLEPVMNYRIKLPQNEDVRSFLPKLKTLEEEDPQLHITWNSFLHEIHIGLMGNVQAEILKSLIFDRFDAAVEIDDGKVMYKETISDTVEGVGHYEPLRHYAEVHLILEPLPRGRGIEFCSKCSETVLDRNWQRLIMTNLSEKEHLGVLTGSPITDMKITLVAGRAHQKHTEGGDFRQATYRAIRQGLMQSKSVLLEPYCRFRLEIPYEFSGRAISDIRMRYGEFSSPESNGEFAIITGKAPLITMNTYACDVASYTSGTGRLFFENAGYDICHNEKEIIEKCAYSPERDTDNTPDSVFCAHGAGFNVKWDNVKNYMHIETCLKKEKELYPVLNTRNFHIDDKELEAIMEKEFGAVKTVLYRPKKPNEIFKNPDEVVLINRKHYVIVDGYNVIFCWDELREKAKESLEDARNALADILSNYSAFTKNKVVLVFDAYKVAGNNGKKYVYNNIHIAFTKENELGDIYIEKLIRDIGKNENVRVVTGDRLIQLTAVRYGVLRVSAREFGEEIDHVNEQIREVIEEMKAKGKQ